MTLHPVDDLTNRQDHVKQAVRLTGLVAFTGSIALLGWWWTTVAGLDAPGPAWSAVGWDVALFSAFAVHHSVLARPFASRIVERVVPCDLVRSAYVWVASLLLTAMCMFWRPVGGLVYNASGALASALYALQVLGIAIGTLAVRRISLRELAGLAEASPGDTLQLGGPYRLVRHPLYLGWVLVFFGAPHVTGDRLLFAAISTAYLLLAMPLEEAGLAKQFGARYLEYRRVVRWRLIPYLH